MFRKCTVLTGLLALGILALQFEPASAQLSKLPKLDHPKKWEYKVVTESVMGTAPEGEGKDLAIIRSVNLTKLGEEGWELVTVQKLGDEPGLYYFKRSDK